MPLPPPPTLHVVGSASIWVLGQVAGPRRTATVLHAGTDAVYLDLEGACLAVLAARAVQVPCGVRTLLPRLPEVEAGTAASVHDGSVIVPGCEVLVTNIVDTTVPVLGADDTAWGAEQLATLVKERLDPVSGLLPPGALRLLADGDAAVVERLLGLGPGLTPVGDDVLAGWLATAVACRHPHLPRLRSTVALAASERTSVLSATLLACAARGEGVPEFRSLLIGVATRNLDVLDQSLELMLRIGDTSGAGLVLGSLAALTSATTPSTPGAAS
ncbi:MAG TPA: DUF2877 domain-containing protein [Marmoricola sp.]|nr:DUF2877 domain-containing protein [Marmoricola sp.]